MRTRTRGLALVAAAVLAVSGCGTATEPPPAQNQPPPSEAEPKPKPTSAKPKPKPQAPAELKFTAKTLDGDRFDGTSLAGKPAVLWFWAPWCPICNREAPTIAQSAETHGDQVTFVGVAAQDELPAMQQFADKHQLDTFVHLNDERAAVWAKFDVTHQPAFAFISADGEVEVVKGTLSQAELSSKLEALAG